MIINSHDDDDKLPSIPQYSQYQLVIYGTEIPVHVFPPTVFPGLIMFIMNLI